MFYIQNFQNNRLDYLKEWQRLRLSTDPEFRLCSEQYIDKYPQFSRSNTSNIGYPRDQTLFFLSQRSSTEMMLFYLNVKLDFICSARSSAERLIKQAHRSTNDNQPKPPTSTTSNLSKPAANRENESASMRLYHQISRNANALNKSPVKGSSSVESNRSMSTPLTLDDNLRAEIAAKLKSTHHLRTPRIVDLTDSLENLDQSSISQFKSPRFEAESSFFEPSIESIPMEEQIEPKILRRESQTKVHGFQHIANLGSRHRFSDKTRESEYGEEIDQSSKRIYEYKSPFSEEYDQAIACQAQLTGNPSEWNLKDFYRDAKTPFESETNTKSVFEKCLKLSRLQSNTIKWEQRRRQNLTVYNRLLKNSSFDTPANLVNTPANISEIKRELRCTQCKHVSCLGNCAPGQEYQQYKRFIPLTSLPTTREQIRSKLGLRSQRSMLDIRPRSEQTNFSPIVVVPLFDEETSTTKPSTKKVASGFFPARACRQAKREPMTFLSSSKLFS